MKKLLSVFALAFACLATPAHAAFSDSITLERYILIDGNTFEYDSGFLLMSGQFQVITSSIEYYSFYGLSPDFIANFSGKPMMSLFLYNAYKAQGLIPKWVRSQNSYTIGFADYVAVAVSGKGDPNPTPTITTQPENDRELVGDSAFFYVEAEPYSLLTYQWYFKNKAIPGETSDYLWVHSVTKKQAGLYKVAVSAGGTPVMSQNALLQIVTPVSVKKQPKSQTVKAGKNVTFSVSLSGTAPFTYQWYWSGGPLTNATNSFYVVSKAQTTNSGIYFVSVDNDLSWTTSSNAVLTVTP